MSQAIALALANAPKKNRTRVELLALIPPPSYDDGRTKQSFRDECDINLIMQRAAQGGTISHLAKHEGEYTDYSDFDFFEQTQKLTRGREIFDDLPAEIRREFGQSPAAFFAYVNDPANINELAKKLPGLAKPGDQLIDVVAPDADTEAAAAAADAVPAATKPPRPAIKPETSPSSAESAD